jgi:hypothetical protein
VKRGLYAGGALVVVLGTWALLARRARASASKGGAPLPSAPRTLSTEEIDKLFGPLPWKPVDGDDSAIVIDPAWAATNLVQVEIPQLKGVKGAPADGRVTLHRDIAPRVQALFAAWERAGLKDRLVSWHGSFAPRKIRDRDAVSKHAHGVAFDVNKDANDLGKAPAPAGAPGSVVELVPLALEHGFTWGGFWTTRPDGMHFEPFR